MTGICIIDVLEVSFMDNYTTFTFVYLHLIGFRPVPYDIPGLIKGFFSYSKYCDIIGISEDLVAFLVKFRNEVIYKHCKERRTNNTTLNYSLIDLRATLTIEHL